MPPPPSFCQNAPHPQVRSPPMVKNFSVMDQNFMDSAKKLQVEGSNPAHGKNFSYSGAKFHACGMGVWGGMGARGQGSPLQPLSQRVIHIFSVKGQGLP